MKKRLAIISTILSVSVLCACNLPEGRNPTGLPADATSTQIVSTLAALTQSVQPTPLASLTLSASATVSQPTFTPSPTLTLTLTPALSPTPTITPIPKPGTIAGGIHGYPYGSIPRLAIVASEQEPPYNYSYVVTTSGDTYYSIGGVYVVPGQWRVVAYDPSGHAGGCTATVTVISEQTVTCDITDWSGSYPAKPAGVPDP